jgi:hypothetical protein
MFKRTFRTVGKYGSGRMFSLVIRNVEMSAATVRLLVQTILTFV